MASILEVAGVVILLNLPFGYFRASVKRFSVPWFVAVHAGVTLVVGVRLLAGVGWHLSTLPIFLGAYAGRRAPCMASTHRVAGNARGRNRKETVNGRSS